jgi:hypothetical protein
MVRHKGRQFCAYAFPRRTFPFVPDPLLVTVIIVFLEYSFS